MAGRCLLSLSHTVGRVVVACWSENARCQRSPPLSASLVRRARQFSGLERHAAAPIVPRARFPKPPRAVEIEERHHAWVGRLVRRVWRIEQVRLRTPIEQVKRSTPRRRFAPDERTTHVEPPHTTRSPTTWRWVCLVRLKARMPWSSGNSRTASRR